MRRKLLLVATGTALLLPGAPETLWAQEEYPSKAVEFIVPWSPGGGSDTLMRILAAAMEEPLGVSVPVINMPGVSGTSGLKEAAQRAPDGYTIAQIHDGLVVAHHTGLTELNWDTFTPVAQATSSPQFLVVNADSPWQTFEDFAAHVRDNPGEVKFGVTLAGVPHLHAAMIEEAIGGSFSYVGFEGTGERIRGLLGGTIDAAIGDIASAGEFVENGDLRFLAVGSTERLEQAPDVPTLQELGHDLELTVVRGIVVPEGTPEERIDVLSESVGEAINDPETKEKLNNAGAEAVYKDQEAYTEALKKLNETVERLSPKLES